MENNTEEKIEVKTVDSSEDIVITPQEKEAAVLETAVKEGEVNPDYGLQDDGVYKVNLDKPPTKKENAVQEQQTEEVPVQEQAESGEETVEAPKEDKKE